jgi:uncharacterized metal-binding protein YceD (DUF177 family)
MENPIFLRPIQVDILGPNPKRIKIDANSDELRELEERFDLKQMDFLTGEAILKRISGQKIECKITAKAKITQICVVSLKPVVSAIDVSFRRVYGSASERKSQSSEIIIDIDADDELEPILDGVIDIAEALTEELGLEIDPFPRAEGSDFSDFGVGPDITEDEVQALNPFAALSGLKKKSD